MTDLALLSVDEMYQADRGAVTAGVDSLTLMENAGRAVVSAIRARWSPRPVAVLCGPGNNGGDGFVIARLLRASGWPVRLALLGDPGHLTGDAAANQAQWTGPTAALHTDILAGAGLVIDALFGAGLSRPVEGVAADVLRAIAVPCIAVDIPSGIDGNTGTVMGTSTRAALTVTFCRAKPGHWLMPGREQRGELIVADIGIPDHVIAEISPSTALNEPDLWANAFPFPNAESHKYRRGHAVVIGGETMTGAARLATRAARRIGAGLVTIASSERAFPIYASADPGHLVSTAPLDDLLSDPRKNAVLVGPGAGVGNTTREHVIKSLLAGKATVIDADALTSFSDSPNTLFDNLIEQTVLTPHEGEFSRLFPEQGDKLTRTRNAAALCGGVVLLKGADTVIAAPDGRAVINTTGTPYLATGGSGDVLAGMITGLLAQGMAPFAAAAAATWIHGRAASAVGPGLIAEDLTEMIPEILGNLISSGVRKRVGSTTEAIVGNL